MNPAAIAIALWPELLKLVKKLGGWIIDKLVEIGARALQRLCVRRIRKLKRRAVKNKTKEGRKLNESKAMRRTRRRSKVLDRKIEGWKQLNAWLVKNSERIEEKVAKEIEAVYNRAISEKLLDLGTRFDYHPSTP